MTGVGTVANPIETQVAALEADTFTGGISLSNIGNLKIGGVHVALFGLLASDAGDISLTNPGSIILAEDNGLESVHSAGNVVLTAIGATADITSNRQQRRHLRGGRHQPFGRPGRDVRHGRRQFRQ